MVEIAFLAGLLAVYNNAANSWPPFSGAWFVPLNAAFTLLVLMIAVAAGASAGEMGLRWDPVALAAGVAAGIVLTLPVHVAARIPASASMVADERVADLRGAVLVYQVLLRVPVGTAVTEEVAFRGALLALAAAAWSTPAAVVLSSAVFGLWHVVPTLILVRTNRPGARPATKLAAVAAAVVVTGIAGALFAWLRLRWGTLMLPIGVHAAINSSATLAGVTAHRVRGRTRPGR